MIDHSSQSKIYKYIFLKKIKNCFFSGLNPLLLTSKHFKNIKSSLKNDPLHKYLIINICYFASKYLKRTFVKSYIKSDPSNIVLV